MSQVVHGLALVGAVLIVGAALYGVFGPHSKELRVCEDPDQLGYYTEEA